MRDVGLALALILALAFGRFLMGQLNDWLQCARIRDEDDEANGIGRPIE